MIFNLSIEEPKRTIRLDRLITFGFSLIRRSLMVIIKTLRKIENTY